MVCFFQIVLEKFLGCRYNIPVEKSQICERKGDPDIGVEIIISLICYGFLTVTALTIGILQFRNKKEPVGFYSGEKRFTPAEISDVSAWNRKHGAMWIIYGVIVLLSCILGTFILGDTLLCLIPLCGGIIVPVGFMIWYHHYLIRKYKI